MDGSKHSGSAAGQGPFRLAPLPFTYRSLAGAISERTLRTHHGVHHAKYVKNANELARKAGLTALPQEDLIRRAHGESALQGLYDNAAQAWNHDFYWRSLRPRHSPPAGELRTGIINAFGSARELVTTLVESGTAQFGSGWVWLTRRADGALGVESTGNADSPLVTGSHPLLCFDVWEHAYYLDYKADRKAHLKAVISRHANWAFAADRLASDPA